MARATKMLQDTNNVLTQLKKDLEKEVKEEQEQRIGVSEKTTTCIQCSRKDLANFTAIVHNRHLLGLDNRGTKSAVINDLIRRYNEENKEYL